ncbi:unnamed protein product [Knipowitschia caucasica]|uniref:Bucky ball n=1 Tax=Knipowitschia caucasica TaxID=637954 RepID=A0AAV2L856_KNICA
MEDGAKGPHNGGQQRTHHRPFFYVQPPSQPQPYYMYQHWQMNNPYGHYALPGGYNMGRQCLSPYQYMQYPGFMYPQAPLYPMDFRRMFDPRFPCPPWDGSSRHQPSPPPQPPGFRETACSEAQTDPSDAIAKLIECLDKMQASEGRGAEGRELDSGVASQSSTMFSPTEEKNTVQKLQKNQSYLETPASTFSTMAGYDGDLSHRSLERWAEEMPLDSSSVQEEAGERAQEQVVPVEPPATGVPTDGGAPDEQSVPCDGAVEGRAPAEELDVDVSFQILKLPFELPSESPYYNYLSTHERLSVLSPSLDELSSRDEMFSTDLDEVELLPRHVYAGGRRLGADVVCRGEADKTWTVGSKRFVCACCGKGLPNGARSKGHCTKVYLDEGADSDDDDDDGGGGFVRGCDQPIRVVVRKHNGSRKTPSLPHRLTKSWSRRGPGRDQAEPGRGPNPETEAQEEGSTEGTDHGACLERVCREEPSRRSEAAVRRRTTAAHRLELQRNLQRSRDEDPLPWDRGAAPRDPPC